MSYWPGFHLGLHKIFLQGPVRGFHKDLCKIFLQGPLQDLGTRLFCRSENSHKDLYKIMQGPLGGFHLQLDLDKIFLQPPDFLEHNVHTCPQDIFLYLITWLAFHYWYASNCSSSFLDAGVLSHVRDAKRLGVGYTTVIVATQSEVWQINALSCQPPQCP